MIANCLQCVSAFGFVSAFERVERGRYLFVERCLKISERYTTSVALR